MKQQKVILVDENDVELGVMDKMDAHRKGLLHRAFSIFIFDLKGRMLLQQRSPGKYHGGGLWTNACCSHPVPGEAIKDAATRRLEEELGFITPLKEIFAFTYSSNVENGLVEHEYDHVLAGQFEGEIFPDQAEVASFRYVDMEDIKEEMDQHADQFTTWFTIAFPKIETWWSQRYKEKFDKE